MALKSPLSLAAAGLICLAIGVAGCSREEAAPPVRSSQSAILVRISDQKLYLVDNGRVIRRYPISTSKYGIGNQNGSFKTPLGRHRIAKKIGAGAPINTVFKDRVNTGRTAAINTTLSGAPHDDVTTRILWLEGLEPGVNRGKGIDSKERFIYIHGTTSEGLIGRPASNGCVRMYNRDVVELFDRVPEGTPVIIVN